MYIRMYENVSVLLFCFFIRKQANGATKIEQNQNDRKLSVEDSFEEDFFRRFSTPVKPHVQTPVVDV